MRSLAARQRPRLGVYSGRTAELPLTADGLAAGQRTVGSCQKRKSRLIFPEVPGIADRMARVIEYALVGSGWALGTITLDGRRIELDASYIHDTFTGIVEGLLRACSGQEAVEWVYFHEPDSTH